MVVLREKDVATDGEVIRTVNRKGGILTAQICVLDDISRAPGEALNVLLRVLNERRFGGERLPLLTAIATGNPVGEAYYNEPLDPANLDRFAIQLKTGGLVSGQAWEDVAKVITRFEASGDVGLEAVDVRGMAPGGLLSECNAALPRVTLPDTVGEALLRLMQVLVVEHEVKIPPPFCPLLHLLLLLLLLLLKEYLSHSYFKSLSAWIMVWRNCVWHHFSTTTAPPLHHHHCTTLQLHSANAILSDRTFLVKVRLGPNPFQFVFGHISAEEELLVCFASVLCKFASSAFLSYGSAIMCHHPLGCSRVESPCITSWTRCS